MGVYHQIWEMNELFMKLSNSEERIWHIKSYWYVILRPNWKIRKSKQYIVYPCACTLSFIRFSQRRYECYPSLGESIQTRAISKSIQRGLLSTYYIFCPSIWRSAPGGCSPFFKFKMNAKMSLSLSKHCPWSSPLHRISSFLLHSQSDIRSALNIRQIWGIEITSSFSQLRLGL